MTQTNHNDDRTGLAAKIARLVEEGGWNQDAFAKLAGLNRHTVRKILHADPEFRIRIATVSSCARAFGLSVHELRNQPLNRLLPKIRQRPASLDVKQKQFEEATQPELRRWLMQYPERAVDLSAEEMDELLSLQGTGGPMTLEGVEHFVHLIERRRKLIEQVEVLAGTEYFEVLEKLIQLMYEKVQPYPDRK